jgi:hypothetical protein
LRASAPALEPEQGRELAESGEVGCALALHASIARYAVVKALQTAFMALHRDGGVRSLPEMFASFDEYNAVLGLDRWLSLERKYRG